MKHAIVVAGGAADEPLEQLDGRTPLDAATTPSIHWIATNGRQGCVVAVPDGLDPGTDVATLSLLGYDPRLHLAGQAAYEAVARGVEVGPNELVFRCDFVTIADGVMRDASAGGLSRAEAVTPTE